MSELGTIVKEIEKNKGLEANLPMYMNLMMTLYHRFSNIRLSMNYYDLKENSLEFGKLPDDYHELFEQVSTIMKKGILGSFDPVLTEHLVSELHQIRKQVCSSMHIITAYADCLHIYDNLLVPHLWRTITEFDDNMSISDEEFLDSIMDFIAAEPNVSAVSDKVNKILSILPIRMTKARYFDIIRDSFKNYVGAEKTAVSEYMYIFRTVASLEQPEKESVRYEKLDHMRSVLSAVDFENISEEQAEELLPQMREVKGYIYRATDIFTRLEEVINDVYIILLTRPYALTDAKEVNLFAQIMEKTFELNEDSDGLNEDQELEQLFEQLEGKQERIMEQISAYDFLIDSLVEEKTLIDGLVLDKIFASLRRILQLSSTSLFIDLDEVKEEGTADKEYISQRENQMIQDLTASFQQNTKLVNRSIMSETLQLVPMFLRDLDEIKDYILYTLKSIRDKQEKQIVIARLEAMMLDYNMLEDDEEWDEE